jgi:hypothetical protein
LLIKIENKELLFSAVYKAPNVQLKATDFDIFTKSAEWILAAGDLNAKHTLWNSKLHNLFGNTIHNHFLQNDYTVYVPNIPT